MTLQDIQRHVGVTPDGKLRLAPPSWMSRGHGGAIHAPFVFPDTTQKLEIGDAGVARNVHAVGAPPFPIEPVAPPFVSALVVVGGPTAILRTVRAIRIYSIKRMVRRWFRPHVVQKGLRRIFPSLAHYNAPSAVKRIAIVALAIASGFSRVIGHQFGGYPAAPSLSVGNRAQTKTITPKAATAFGFPSLNRICGDHGLISAFAAQKPHVPPAIRSKRPNYRQPALRVGVYLGPRLHGKMI